MKTYKKPISITIVLGADEIMQTVTASVLQKPDEHQSRPNTEYIEFGGDATNGPGDAKGFDSWE